MNTGVPKQHSPLSTGKRASELPLEPLSQETKNTLIKGGEK